MATELAPSHLYQQYKSQLIENCNKLETLSPQSDQQVYNKILHDSEMLLKHISIELCSLGSVLSGEQSSKIAPYKKKLMKHKKIWEQFVAKEELLGNRQSDSSRQLLENLENQNDKLSECKKLLYDMESISEEIGANLHSQTEKMRGSTQKVRKVSKIMDTANGIVDRMISRENRRAYTVRFVLVMVVLVIGFLKYCCY